MRVVVDRAEGDNASWTEGGRGGAAAVDVVFVVVQVHVDDDRRRRRRRRPCRRRRLPHDLQTHHADHVVVERRAVVVVVVDVPAALLGCTTSPPPSPSVRPSVVSVTSRERVGGPSLPRVVHWPTALGQSVGQSVCLSVRPRCSVTSCTPPAAAPLC